MIKTSSYGGRKKTVLYQLGGGGVDRLTTDRQKYIHIKIIKAKKPNSCGIVHNYISDPLFRIYFIIVWYVYCISIYSEWLKTYELEGKDYR